MRTISQRAGDEAETIVAGRLESSGWQVVGRQVRLGRLEVDIVAVDPGPPAALVIVEVRWRRRRDYGLPEETLDWRKRTRLRRAALELSARALLPDGRPTPRLPIRIDLVVLEPPARAGDAPRLRHHRHVA